MISANDLSHDTGTRVAVVERRAGALGRCVESAQRAGAARGLLCAGGEGGRELTRVLLLFRAWRWWDRSDSFLD